MSRLKLRFLILAAALLSAMMLLSTGACGSNASSQNTGMLRPNGVALDASGMMYVMDLGNHRIVQFDAEGRYQGSIGKFGSQANQIYYGWDVALDSQGNIYICNIVSGDEGVLHDGVKVFSPEGRFLREIGAADYPPDYEMTPNTPYALDIDSQDRIYISDYGALQVRVFDSDGNLLATLASDPEKYPFEGLGDLVVDDERGLLYLLDLNDSRLYQFKIETAPSLDSAPAQFSLLRTIGEYGRELGQFAFPQGIAVNERTGWVYVGDQANRRIQILDEQGNFIRYFSAPTVRDWQALGLTVGPFETIFAADTLNNIVWEFSAGGQFIRRYEVEK